MVSRTIIASYETNIKKSNVSTIQRVLWLGNLIYYQTVAVLTVVSLWVFFANNELSEPMLWHMVFSTIAVSISALFYILECNYFLVRSSNGGGYYTVFKKQLDNPVYAEN